MQLQIQNKCQHFIHKLGTATAERRSLHELSRTPPSGFYYNSREVGMKSSSFIRGRY